MNDCLDDAYLYAQIPRAEEAMLRALPREEHRFSRRFERKMRALLRYERRTPLQRAAARAGRIAAAVLAAAILLNAALIGTVKAYREGFLEILEEVRRKFTAFHVETGETLPVTEFVPIEPPYIPEGYEEIDRITNEVKQIIVYMNAEGKDISVSQTELTLSRLYYNTEDATVETIRIQDRKVYVITKDSLTQVFFITEAYEFSICGAAGYAEIMEVTNSIIKLFEK